MTGGERWRTATWGYGNALLENGHMCIKSKGIGLARKHPYTGGVADRHLATCRHLLGGAR